MTEHQVRATVVPKQQQSLEQAPDVSAGHGKQHTDGSIAEVLPNMDAGLWLEHALGRAAAASASIQGSACAQPDGALI